MQENIDDGEIGEIHVTEGQNSTKSVEFRIDCEDLDNNNTLKYGMSFIGYDLDKDFGKNAIEVLMLHASCNIPYDYGVLIAKTNLIIED